MSDLSYMFAEPRETDEMLAEVLDRVDSLVGSDGSVLVLESEGSAKIAAARGLLEHAAGTSLDTTQHSILDRCFKREQLQVQQRLDRPLTFLAQSFDHLVAVPLHAHSRLFGAIAVGRQSGTPFTAHEIESLAAVGGHTAVILANQRLFELVQLGKNQWESTFDALTDAVCVVDVRGRIVRANKSMAQLIDRDMSNTIGRHLQDAVFGNSRDLENELSAAREGIATAGRNFHSPKLDRVLHIAVAPVSGRYEDLTVVLIADFTEQKQLEAQLIQSDKMATIGQLVSGVAHELNNPLASITGLSELLLSGGSDAERARRHLEVINEQATRAGTIVENLLTFARATPTDRAAVDLNELVRRTVQLIHYELTLREVECHTSLAPNLPPVQADQSQIQQVILNLVTNAYQALEDNHRHVPGRIEIATERCSLGVKVIVEDSGPGVPPEVLTQIFAPFVTTKEQGRGTGLGLSISYGITKEHSGSLNVGRSNDLGGARFELVLPASATEG